MRERLFRDDAKFTDCSTMKRFHACVITDPCPALLSGTPTTIAACHAVICSNFVNFCT